MGKIVIASAIIWAAVLVASAIVEPAAFGKLIPVLGGGAAAHIIILGAASQKYK